MKDKTTAGLLAIFLGVFGAHKWYLEQPGGCAYPFFSFATGFGLAPVFAIVSLVEGISYLTMSKEEFDRRYNRVGLWTSATSTVTTTTVVHGPSGPVVVERRVQTAGPNVDIPVGRPVQVEVGPTVGTGHRQPMPAQPDYALRKPRNQEERERFVLQAAADREGALTPSELALMSQLNIREAKQALDELQRQGVCDLDVDEDTGLLTYTFPELAPRPQPRQARMAGRGTQKLEEDLDV